jgi:hypothetical protein
LLLQGTGVINSWMNRSLVLLDSFCRQHSECFHCCNKWLSMLSNYKSTNNTASIITTWCLYYRTKVSLVMLLFKVLQRG